ncbi:MAG: ATP synthase subunit I [Leptolyngbya sp. SIO1D8]|nr:ATP synthase subunit I [Leptolyngbya sp. SIO1D8]
MMPSLITAIVGFGLGCFYFVGLWLTVQQIGKIQQPLGLKPLGIILLSFGLRLGVVLLGGYEVIHGMTGQLEFLPLLTCAAGFVLARTVLISHISCQP